MILKRSKNRGQLLIEVLAALGVGIVVISAVTIAVINALSNTLFSKNQNLATLYAQQGIETVRKIHDSDQSGFNSLIASENVANLCLGKNDTTPSARLVSGCGQNVDSFVREVKIDDTSCKCGSIEGKNIRRVSVAVKWSDSKCFAPPTPTLTPTLTPTPFEEESGGGCFFGFCIFSTEGGGTGPLHSFTPTPTPTLTPTPAQCASDSLDTKDNTFCHQVQLSSCLD